MNFLKPRYSWIGLAIGSALSVSVFGSLCAVTPSLAFEVPTEAQSRSIDEKALLVKKSALATLGGIVRNSKGRPQEAELLMRQSELYQDAAAISYRLAFGPNAAAVKSPGASTPQSGSGDLGEFNSLMKGSLVPLNRLIMAYPRYSGTPRAYRLRARVYEETGQTNAAINDLKHLVETWPRNPDAENGHLDLWTLLILQKDYESAIKYIHLYGLRPTDKHYHAALEKLSWCSFYLGSMTDALDFTETELKTATGLERSKAISNLGLFYATGMERKIPNLDATYAIARFQKNVKTDEFGKMLVSFVYILRSKGLSNELQVIKDQVAKLPLSDSNRSDFLLATSEDELNHSMWTPLRNTLAQENALYWKSSTLQKDKKTTEKVRNRYIATAQVLQKIVTESKPVPVPTPSASASAAPLADLKENNGNDTVTAQTMQSTAPPMVLLSLAHLYDFLWRTTPNNPLEQSKIQYDLAEVTQASGDLNGATKHYRWIVDHLSFSKKEQSELFVRASLLALETRYDWIKANKWIAGELIAKPLNTKPRAIPGAVTEWISWVDSFPQQVYLEKKVDSSTFEANKILYSFDHIQDSIDRLNDFVKKYPTSTHAVASASLIIDTYIESKEWKKTYSASLSFLQVKPWQSSDFHNKLMDVFSDSYCKILDDLYQQKDYANTLKGSDDFLAKNPTTKRKPDLLELSANASLGLGDKQRALTYFKQLTAIGDKKPEVVSLGFMTEGSIAEEHFQFEQAARAYTQYISSSGKNTADLKNKILLFAWLSGNNNYQKEVFQNKSICPSLGDADCQNYQGKVTPHLAILDQLDKDHASQFSNITKKINLLKQFPEAWDKTDALVKYALMRKLFEAVPVTVTELRAFVRRDFKIKLEAKSIQARVLWAQKSEEAILQITKLPWTHLRLIALLETAGLYDDIISDFKKIREPKGLSDQDRIEYQKTIADAYAPFQQKIDDLSKSAVALATQNNLSDDDLSRLVAEFQRSDLARTKHDEFFGSDFVSMIKTDSDKPVGQALIGQYKAALDKANWIQAGFLVQWAQNNKAQSQINPSTLSAMKAYLLAKEGAVSESIAELRASQNDFSGGDKSQIAKIIQVSTVVEPVRLPAATASGSPLPGASPSTKAQPTPSASPEAVKDKASDLPIPAPTVTSSADAPSRGNQ